jgi:penicillin amidase/acyl-homoserine-lactone acylase
MAIRMLALTVSALALASCATAPVPTYAPGAPFDGTIAHSVAQNYDARVIRDKFGVPHIYGKRNADVAYGLAYAHAEDDWKTI